MTPQNLITVTGNLRDGYKQLQPGTMRHVDELTDERRTNPIDAEGTDLRKVWLYTADGELYSVRNCVPTLAMTRGDVNPVLYRIDDALAQLTTTGNFRPNREEIERALMSHYTVQVDLTKLRLKSGNDEWQYLVIPTKRNHGLRKEEEKLARRFFGEATFAENMEMFRDAGIDESKIYVLAPSYVREHASESPVGRASWLYNFDINSYFDASGRDIDGNYRVRGVRREIREADALKNQVPSVPQEMKSPSEALILEASRPYISEHSRTQWAADLGRLFKP